jgi:hypothetical protein
MHATGVFDPLRLWPKPGVEPHGRRWRLGRFPCAPCVTLLARYLPARRPAATNLLQALRQE